ncbi:MAG: Hsp20/alpha crystallin family protein [Desulfobacterales bacterium]
MQDPAARHLEEAGEQDLLMEYEVGKYYRQFTMLETVDQQKVDAKLEDRLLRLNLPKVEKAPLRKITVRTG